MVYLVLVNYPEDEFVACPYCEAEVEVSVNLPATLDVFHARMRCGVCGKRFLAEVHVHARPEVSEC